MRFTHTDEQRDFARTLDTMLTAADPVRARRAWAADDTGPGLELWRRLADQGVCGLLVPEDADGLEAGAVELVIAFEAIGRHGVPGPWVESAAYLPLATKDPDLLSALAGGAVATVAAPPHTPYLLDADVADHVVVAGPDGLVPVEHGERVRSVDRARRLFRLPAGVSTGSTTGAKGTSAGPAFDHAALAAAAQLLGAGERLLSDTVAYVKQRRQFGREIGSYQAVKHRLADVRIALDFARPLVDGAALAVTGPDAARDVSAAKAAAGDAAYLASRAALQLHGAIGYTEELDVSQWILTVRALVGAWGTPAFHRSRVLDALVADTGKR